LRSCLSLAFASLDNRYNSLEKGTDELRSWVQLPPGPFFITQDNYGIKSGSFSIVVAYAIDSVRLNVEVDLSPTVFDLSREVCIRDVATSD
jgi:hypothetical protein